MKLYYLIFVVLVLSSSCLKNKKKGSCEFDKIEYVELKSLNGAIKNDKTIFECLQLEVNKDVMRITNKSGTIDISYSISADNIIEEIAINLNNEIDESFDSVEEQEIELNEAEKVWEITLRSNNESKFNGYLKLYKNVDGDYWETKKEL